MPLRVRQEVQEVLRPELINPYGRTLTIEAMVAKTKDSYHVVAINQFLGAAALEDGGQVRSTKYAWPNERGARTLRNLPNASKLQSRKRIADGLNIKRKTTTLNLVRS